MCYVWHTNIDGEIVIHEDALRLVPELSGINAKLLKYIILYSDYRRSPIKDFPNDQRDRIAKIKSGFKESDDLLIDPDNKAYFDALTSLIYDERREQRRILQEKLETQKRKVRDNDADNLKVLKDTIEIQRFLEGEIQRIDTALSAEGDNDDPDVKGSKSLSYIERWQRRRKKFQQMMPNDEYK